MVKFQRRSEGCRAVSPIRFFDPILNNALALRASQKDPRIPNMNAKRRQGIPPVEFPPWEGIVEGTPYHVRVSWVMSLAFQSLSDEYGHDD